MAVPIVSCDAKIVIPWNEGGGFYNAYFSATATGSPTNWTWTILSVPIGLEAILSGSWGDFANGVAIGPTMQGPSLTGIPTNVVAGTIVVQCVATNGDGPSVPTVDKANGQQCVVIKTEKLDLPLPGNKEYNWGGAQLDEVLRKLETGAVGAKPMLFRSPKLVNLGAITAAKAAGSIVTASKAALNDGDEVAVPDGDNPLVHFIFDKSGAYTPPGGYDATHVRVLIQFATTAQDVADTTQPVIAASAGAGDLNIDAIVGGGAAEILLTNKASGTFGNLDITKIGACAVTGMTGGAGDLKVLNVAGGEAPSEPAAVGAVVTSGAVVARNATFGSLSLAVVAGKNAIMPANMVLIRDAATDDPVLFEGKTVYGLLHCESAVNGHVFNDSSNRVAITFVREIDSTSHVLGYVKGEAVDGLSLNYSYAVRAALAALQENAYLEGGFTDGVAGGGEGGGGLNPVGPITDMTYDANVGELVTMTGPEE